jgi:arginine deiminase
MKEEHSDLLELLAQQEVEVKVFRNALFEKLGVNIAIEVEQDAERKVVSEYGSYTNYRKKLDESNADNSILQIA